MSAILFDLDGTLLNTLDDLADAVNVTLTHFGCPERSLEEVRQFVGNGAERLIRLALPGKAAGNNNEVVLFQENVKNTSYIGEIGLDFSKDGISTKDIQISVLRKILRELKGKKKIISVHSRKAERELLELLCEYEIENVIFHWYSGPLELIPSIVSCGYYFSINEAMVLSKNGQNIIKNIPKNRILTETDAPYNKKVNINNVLTYLQMTEQEVKNNFMNLVAKVR